MQQAADFRARGRCDYLTGEGCQEVIHFKTQGHARGNFGFHTAAKNGHAFGLVRIGQQGQTAERLRDSRLTCSLIKLDAAADRDEGPDASFRGGEVKEKVIVDGLRLAAERGFGPLAL